MSQTFSGLSAVLGAVLAPLAQDGILHTTTLADTGLGGVMATSADTAIKVLVESLSAQDRIGLPHTAVRLVVLRAGLAAAIALDDSLTVATTTYRIIQVDRDPAGAGFSLTGVPA